MAFYYELPNTLPEGDYTIYSALVKKDSNLRVAANWFSFDEDTFAYLP